MANTHKEWNMTSRRGGSANGIHNYIRGEFLLPRMQEAGIPSDTQTFDTKVVWSIAQKGRIIFCIEVRRHDESNL